jgi:ribonuclease PH
VDQTHLQPAEKLMRHDGRQFDELRPITIQRHFTGAVPGSVLIKAGRTTVLCTASIDGELPPWKKREADSTGWITAEYNMLPGSTTPRKPRERSKIDGRTNEIQRLIGRSLRAIVDLAALGPRMVTVDCDVLEADGGTRTLSITGGFIALVDSLAAIADRAPTDPPILTGSVAAISVGVVNGEVVADLDYLEDKDAEVDMNVVMTGLGQFVEVQGTAEQAPFHREQLHTLLALAEQSIVRLTQVQRMALGDAWPFAE